MAIVLKCSWWKRVSLAQRLADITAERDYQSDQLKRMKSQNRALAKRFAACNAELGAVKDERDNKSDQLKQKTSQNCALAKCFADCNAELGGVSKELVAKTSDAEDFRHYFELQRQSAITANAEFELQRQYAKTAKANAAELQHEVTVLRTFMSDRLGLDCSGVPAATEHRASTATRNGSNAATSSSTLSNSGGNRSDSDTTNDTSSSDFQQASEAASAAARKHPRNLPKKTRRQWKNRLY